MPTKKRDNIPREIRELVLRRDRRTCVYCGRKEGQTVFPGAFRLKIHVDHIIPLSRGGNSRNVFNLCCACSRCNMHKSNKTPEQARMEVAFVQEGFLYVDGQIVPDDWSE
jgi:5-methylcytosine-specific restriction endonuclease McrA